MKAEFLKDKKLVIFDMDGTLIDSLGVWNAVDERVVSIIRNDGLNNKDNMQNVNKAIKQLRTYFQNL